VAKNWCKEKNRPMGELLTVEQVWELSKRWYGDRLSPKFTGRSIAEAHQIFEALGLTSNFWRFDGAG
jgi:hypothetical protein